MADDFALVQNAMNAVMRFKSANVSSTAVYDDLVSYSFPFDVSSFFQRFRTVDVITPMDIILPPLSPLGEFGTSFYIGYYKGDYGTSIVFTPDSADFINDLSAGSSLTIDSAGNVFLLFIFSYRSIWYIGAADQAVDIVPGAGIRVTGSYPDFTIINDLPDQTVTLSAGTGISTTGTYPNFSITNTAPDRTVSLTAGAGISISGTYPNFTITSTATMISKYLLASTTTPTSYAYSANNVVFTAANTFSSTSGDWTNTGGGYITYTGTPALFEAVIRVRCTSSTGLFEPVPTLYINGQWTNQVMTGFTATTGSIDAEYCFGIQINSGVQSTHSMSTIPLFTGDVIGIFFRSNNGLSGTASNFQYTLKIISK